MREDADMTRAYYDSLPGKRVGAGLACRDAAGRVLLVQPTYKPTWELPGGTVEAGESPAAAARREVAEELGLRLPVGRLLVVDWIPVRPPKTEGLTFLFDGGVLIDTVRDRIRLPADELVSWRFFSTAELRSVLPERTARRLELATEIQETGRPAAYLEDGFADENETGDKVNQPTLLLMKGPPGAGKSTIAHQLARRLRWSIIDKDAVRDVLSDDVGGLSYQAMLGLAERQLGIGLSVIADSPLGYGRWYEMALAIGQRTGARVVVIACECSDADEWERRLEARKSAGLASHHTVDRAGVEAFKTRTASDPFEIGVPCLILDTAAPLDETIPRALAWLDREARVERDP